MKETLIKLINGKRVHSIVEETKGMTTREELENYLDEIREYVEDVAMITNEGNLMAITDKRIYECVGDEVVEWTFDNNRIWLKQVIRKYIKIED